MKTPQILLNKIIELHLNTKKRHFRKCGTNVRITKGCRFFHPEKIELGSNIYIGHNAWIDAQGSITIQSGTIIGPRLIIYSANHNYNSDKAIPYDEDIIYSPVIIGENTWIGGNVIILPGVSIGEGCVIGAGSVVTKNQKSGVVIGGNPAKIIKERNWSMYQKLKRENKIYYKIKNDSSKS